jgi:cysteine desulfurase
MISAIYLDHAATTLPRAEVREIMGRCETERFGNPSSVHRWGREARLELETARERLAAVIGASRDEVVFTSSGTESDNLALLGAARAVRKHGGPALVVCSAIEHKAVLGAARQVGSEGARLELLDVDPKGCVDLAQVDQMLEAMPSIVSVLWGNNEVGVLQPVAEIGARCRSAGVFFHTDAVQALGRVRVRVDETPCDLLSISGHKFGGPRGMGALYVRKGVALAPLLHGGGQERQLRPGTQNVAGAVGLALAAELATREMESESRRLGALRDRLESLLLQAVPDVVVNAGGAPRLPHISNLSFPGVDLESLLIALDLEGVAVSSGSACQSGTVEPSHVLVAMRRAVPGEASVRFSLGRTTTSEEIEEAAARVIRVVQRVRAAFSMAG